MRLVSQGIVARGETPFLHVLAENASAIALYEKLGFSPAPADAPDDPAPQRDAV
jgi:predicted GNAT family acetyltransferase